MKSIKELYRIGTGPSSSHTMGPRKAAEMFVERHPDAASFKVTLYGSLAATGKGHMTDVAIKLLQCLQAVVYEYVSSITLYGILGLVNNSKCATVFQRFSGKGIAIE